MAEQDQDAREDLVAKKTYLKGVSLERLQVKWAGPCPAKVEQRRTGAPQGRVSDNPSIWRPRMAREWIVLSSPFWLLLCRRNRRESGAVETQAKNRNASGADCELGGSAIGNHR